MTVLLVALGGAVGTLARYGLGKTVHADALPWLTVAINIAGSFLLGFLIAVGDWFSPEVRTSLAIGVLGGFTTFSTFSADVFLDLDAGRTGEALAYVVVSVAGGVVAAGSGYFLGRAIAH
ncbi:MAG: fluoride exporter [Thermoleophilaceae bacterium]|nr:fluoride exporter [Thermoleophilaceae bacterium]